MCQLNPAHTKTYRLSVTTDQSMSAEQFQDMATERVLEAEALLNSNGQCRFHVEETAALQIPLNATAQGVVKAIDQWAIAVSPSDYYVMSSEPAKLWQMLTALRGPDNGNEPLKYATVALLRGATCPALAARGGAIIRQPVTRDQLQWLSEEDSCGGDVSQHFLHHVVAAAMALLSYHTPDYGL